MIPSFTKKITHMLCGFLAASLFVQPLTARPSSILVMKGLYDILNPKKRHLSPFHGMVWVESHLLHNIYDYGNVEIKKVKGPQGVLEQICGGDATSQLARELFYKVGNALTECRETEHLAAYLSITTIGKILNAIELKLNHLMPDQNIDTFSFNPADFKRLGQHNPEKLHRQIKALRREAKLWEDQNSFEDACYEGPSGEMILKEGPLKNLLTERGDLEQLLKRYSQRINTMRNNPETQGLRNTITTILEETIPATLNGALRKKLTQQARHIANLIDRSLQECGHFGIDQASWSQYTTHMLLVSFVYLKAQNKADFITFFNQFTPSITQTDDYTDLLTQTFDPKTITRKALAAKHVMADTDFENICFAELRETGGVLPQFSQTHTTVIVDHGQTVTDCAEYAMMNFLKTILACAGCYDAASHSMISEGMLDKLVAFFKEIGTPVDEMALRTNSQKLVTLFEKFPDTGMADSIEFHTALATMLSDLPGVTYTNAFIYGSNAINDKRLEPKIHGKPLNGFNAYWIPWGKKQGYLFQIAMYPGSLVGVCNHFFGLNCTKLTELFDALKMTPTLLQSRGETYALSEVSDINCFEGHFKDKKDVPNSASLQLSFICGNMPCEIFLSLSTGHGECNQVAGKITSVARSPLNNILLESMQHYPSGPAWRTLRALQCGNLNQDVSAILWRLGDQQRYDIPLFVLSMPIKAHKHVSNIVKKLLEIGGLAPQHPAYSMTKRFLKMAQAQDAQTSCAALLYASTPFDQLSTDDAFELLYQINHDFKQETQHASSDKTKIQVLYQDLYAFLTQPSLTPYKNHVIVLDLKRQLLDYLEQQPPASRLSFFITQAFHDGERFQTPEIPDQEIQQKLIDALQKLTASDIFGNCWITDNFCGYLVRYAKYLSMDAQDRLFDMLIKEQNRKLSSKELVRAWLLAIHQNNTELAKRMYALIPSVKDFDDLDIGGITEIILNALYTAGRSFPHEFVGFCVTLTKSASPALFTSLLPHIMQAKHIEGYALIKERLAKEQHNGTLLDHLEHIISALNAADQNHLMIVAACLDQLSKIYVEDDLFNYREDFIKNFADLRQKAPTLMGSSIEFFEKEIAKISN